MKTSFRIPHSAFCILHFALSITLSAFAESASVRDNNAKAEGLLRAMADHGRKSKYAEVTNCCAQVEALLALGEDAPTSVTPYRLHMATAHALSDKLHLHWAGLAARHFADALKAANTPRERQRRFSPQDAWSTMSQRMTILHR